MNNEYKVFFEELKKEVFVQEAIASFGEDILEKVYSRAWAFGHASGLDEVKNWFRDLIDIINLTK